MTEQQPRQLRRRRDEQRQRRQRVYRTPTPDAILVTRAQTASMWSCSVATVIRAEHRGLLKPVRLDPTTKNSKVFYTTADVIALAGGGHAK